MTNDIHAELTALRDAAERYRAEATALHAATLERIAEIEAKLTQPKPSGLPTGPGLWWAQASRHLETVRLVVHGSSADFELDSFARSIKWLTDPLGHAIPCPEPDPTRVQLEGPVVRFCEHGVVLDAPEWAAKRFYWDRLREFACGPFGCAVDDLVLDSPLADLLGVYAVYTTPEHAAAWRRELGVSDV